MTNSTQPIRLLLVDDHPLVLDGICMRLDMEADFTVVGTACDGKQALAKIAALNPDIVVMDISMPGMTGVEAAQAMQNVSSPAKLLMLSMHENPEYVRTAVQAGARGYLLKDVPGSELVAAIRAIHAGATWFSAAVTQMLLAIKPPAAEGPLPELTPREMMVLRLLLEDKSSKNIAFELDISVRTVETHRQNLRSKLGAHTTAGLVHRAIALGLLQGNEGGPSAG